MPSITYWNRLEPRARSSDLSSSVAARIHDPAWMLARQWQIGEFHGEDAASPAFARYTAELVPLTSWSAGDRQGILDPLIPLERTLLAEPFSSDDLGIAVELGQAFERLLEAENAHMTLGPVYRSHYSIQEAAGDDPTTARLRAIWQGRTADGLALYRAAKMAAPGLPAPQPPSGLESTARAVIAGLIRWTEDVYPDIGSGDPAGWDPERLEYSVEVNAIGGATAARFSVHPTRNGRFDWYSFDEMSEPPIDAPSGETRTIQGSVIPAAVQFRGMPQPRWWDFEDHRVDFGGMRPDRRDLARLLFMDFMLVHGNDWFLLPFEQPVGTLCRISSLRMRDVFGEDAAIPRGETAGPPSSRWVLFSATKESGSWADGLIVPPSAGPAMALGPDLEDVRFLRDQSANMVWAVERATEGRLGEAVAAAENALRSLDGAATAAPSSPEGPTLRYAIQTRVPRHWLPFLPVRLDASTVEIALELSSLLDAAPNAPPILAEPLGKVLRPSSIGDGIYRIREEEIPREGTRVTQGLRICRWTDGSTHLWIARQRTVGRGEGWAGLRFDVADSGR